MKYDIDQTFLDLEGEPILEGVKEDAKPFTLRAMLTLACLNADPQKYADGEAKYKVYKLLRRLGSKAKELGFESDDIILLKDIVGRVFNVYVVGLIYDVLEKKDEPS